MNDGYKSKVTPSAPPSEKRSTPTSGQVDSKFRQDSKQARRSDHLRRDKPPPSDSSAKDARRMGKSKFRVEKTDAKLDKAKDKLAKQKPLKKTSTVKALGRATKYQAWKYAHGKINQVEQENVGVEAAHKTELAGEMAVRGTSRFIKKRGRTRSARQVRKWERKNTKAKADFTFRQLTQEHPELAKNTLSRFYQKQRIKKRYQKQARETAKATKKAAKKTAVTVEKVAGAAVNFVKRNPKIFIVALCLFLVIVLLQSCMGAALSIGNGLLGAVGGTSYLAEDADIDAAELAYTEWETDLYLEAVNAENTHSGYDEYRYNVADISHNPYELMAFLTSMYDDFTFANVQGFLQQIFNEQYSLSFVEEIEVRYRTETRTDPDTGTEYDVEVPYNWYILHVSLTVRPFTSVIMPRMNSEQLERYNVYMTTKGNRQYLQSPFGETNWLPYVSSYYGYRVHPITGEKDYHKGADIAMPEGTEIVAGQDGTVIFAGTSGDYGLVAVLDNGEGLVSKYAHCSVLLVSTGQTVQAGDLIAKVGNTGGSTGAHLHLEIIKDGQYLNPLYFAVNNDFTHSGADMQGPEYGNPGAAMGYGSYAALITEAERHLGKAYVFGASGPDNFDCSGYVCWVYTKSGVYNIPRTTAWGIYQQCTPIPPSEARPGDLIFFTGTYSTTSPTSHIGIYVGKGMMIHAGDPIQYTSINSSYWQSHFYSYGRLN